MTNFKRFMMMIVAIATLSLNSCKKDNFDEPPTETVDPNIPVTHTIRQLKDLFGGSSLKLTDDIVISGIVVANDKGGNIFNQIIIDDGTAGISVAIDQNALFGEFPIGRKVYVKCKDLYLAASNNLLGIYGALDITGSTVEIPAGLITKYIVKANTGNPVVPIEVTDINSLNNSFQNRLVKISEVEFAPDDTAQLYADAINKQSVSRFVRDCNDGEFEVRTSGYADFASEKTPSGKGSIIGVYTVFRTDKQIILRNTQDVDMNDRSRYGVCPVIIVDTLLFENFESTSGSGVIALTNWTNFASAGTKNWTSTGTTNKNARFSAFSSNVTFQQPSNIGWLITPALNLDLTTNEKLVYRRQLGFVTGTIKMEILYSTDYSGSGDPTTATWTLLLDDAPLASTSFSNASPISLNAISGTSVYFAFRYTGGYGTTPESTTQYNLDNILISN